MIFSHRWLLKVTSVVEGRGWWGKTSSHTEFFFMLALPMIFAVHCKCSRTVRDTRDRFIFWNMSRWDFQGYFWHFLLKEDIKYGGGKSLELNGFYHQRIRVCVLLILLWICFIITHLGSTLPIWVFSHWTAAHSLNFQWLI